MVLGRRVAVTSSVVGLVLLASACGSSAGNRLIIADTGEGGQGSALWAVEPGDPLERGARVATGATAAAGIVTLDAEGEAQLNQVGLDWKGETLLAYQAGEQARATVGEPGGEQTDLASSTSLETVVLSRGVFLSTQEGCSLATDPEGADRVGAGSCSISGSERWVLSWPTEGGELTIRDLRRDRTRTVPGLRTDRAAALSHGDVGLAVTTDDGGQRAAVVDLADGSVVGRTAAFERLQVVNPTPDAESFLVVAQAEGAVRLLSIDADAEVTEIDRAPIIVPVTAGEHVVYLRYGSTDGAGAEAGGDGGDSLRRWREGEGREVLLQGRVGAAAPDAEHVLASRETDRGVEFWTGTVDGDLERAITLRSDASGGVLVNSTLTRGGVTHVTASTASGTSYLRIDLSGGHSAVPVRDWVSLGVDAIDTDGTALVVGTRTQDQQREQIMVVGPEDDEPVVRAQADRTGTNLLHDGVIYLTTVNADGSDVTVRSVRAAGDPEPEVLYRDRQIAGATWDEAGGATQSLFMTRALLSQQAAGAAGPPTG